MIILFILQGAQKIRAFFFTAFVVSYINPRPAFSDKFSSLYFYSPFARSLTTKAATSTAISLKP